MREFVDTPRRRGLNVAIADRPAGPSRVGTRRRSTSRPIRARNPWDAKSDSMTGIVISSLVGCVATSLRHELRPRFVSDRDGPNPRDLGISNPMLSNNFR